MSAVAQKQVAAPAEPGQYLTFELAGAEYGVPLLRVREIIEFTTITAVPLTSRWLLGVINLRGNVVPVIDLGVRFGRNPSEVTKRTCIVIVEVALDDQAVTMGIVADSVRQVVQLDAGAIQPVPALATRSDAAFLLGIGQVGDHFALLLDVDRSLSTVEMEQVASAPGTSGATAARTRQRSRSEVRGETGEG